MTLARRLVALARRAYAYTQTEATPPAWQPDRIDAFTTPGFMGFAASDDRAAYLVFRGTKLHLDSHESFLATLQAWLTNLDYAQIEDDGCLVHRGYARELDEVADRLAEMAQDHALGGKPIYLTGHSAGGALATLAARRLHAAGVPVRAAVVFSAPRVGDRNFAKTYPVPLVRIEHRHDLIPHLPFPPSLARIVGHGLVDRVIGALDWLAPALERYRLARTEYVHAGELFYDDGSEALYRVPPGQYWSRFGPILRQELEADLLRRGEGPTAEAYRAAICPRWATPVPARLMDGVRLSTTLAHIARQARARRLDFLFDHHIDGALAFIDRIERITR
ncbi:lipase family protein [Benzoatithermus flavus]|uniref:Thioesterase domain-containing protein n=1 Tax=Benzoatithermus flavus TaxID=3108223 RepID=A0ABU8XW01_9PROT